MIIDNPFKKPKNWEYRNSWYIRGLTFPYPWQIGKRSFHPHLQEWQEIVPGVDSNNLPLVRGRAFTLSGIKANTIDGFIGHIDGPTPAQYVNVGHTIETPLRGDFYILHIDRQGHLTIQNICLSDQDNSPISLKVLQGEIMSLCPRPSGPNSPMFLETVHPGWTENSFSNIPEETEVFSGVKIPDKFWRIRQGCRFDL